MTAEELATWAIDGVERVLAHVADLTDDQLVAPLLPTINPLLWEIGHIAWFQELFVLRRACGHDPILPYGDALYDSGAIPHDTRWWLRLPSREDTVDYVRTVGQRVADAVTASDTSDVARHFARYTVHHHDTHSEALTYTRQTLGLPLPPLPGLTDTDVDFGVADDDWRGDVRLGGGRFLLGALMADPFVYDNEKWAHPVDVEPFAMAKVPVTQGEFAEFVADGGYTTPNLWSDNGQWLATTGARHPLYWRRGGDGWERRHFDTWVPLEPDHPVNFVCWWEADAFARWAGRRLPTEPEWEFAACSGAWQKPTYPWGDELPKPHQAATDWLGKGTVPVSVCTAGDTQEGIRHLIGNVWEWTASDFDGYPNFERDAYGENSQQFFGERKVLRGGGWATRGRYLRNTMRNYFTHERQDVIAGFRTCAR
ncbi:MAG: ergothioneine biosynthesis protein EgtB [Actinophytocola sp.]|nr:ergothioneine biosynthesis protein EgtB [Actinophytocola sp.]